MALDDLDSAINIATGEVTKNDDPLSRLDSAIDNVVTTQKKRAATVTGIATKFNPDQIAQSRALGRQVGLPDDIAERNPDEVRRKFITQKVSELYDTSPVLGRKLSDPAFAKLSHDITDELAGQESAIKQLALTKQGFREASELSRAMSDQQFSNIIERGRDRVVERGIGDVVGSFGRSIAAGSTGRIGQGVYGALASPFGVLAPLLEPLVGTVLPANPLRVAEQGLLNLSKQQSNVADAIAGDRSEQGFVEGAVNSGFESLGMNLPPLLAGVISNNPSLALNAMVSLTGGQEFAKAREQGLDANQALVYAGSQAAVEWATEKIPVDTLFKGLRGEDGLLKTLLLSNVQEQFGEQAAAVLQDLNEWGTLQKDKPFSEYLAERPEAALQTAIATLVGTTGQVAIAKSIEVAGNYVSTEQEKLQYQSEAANSSMQAFANIQQLAEQSKLKQRSAQDFATFLQEAGGENGLDEVYIDARTLVEEAEKQGVDLNTLMQSSPVINQQLQEAIAQGVDLVIPVGEFGASIAGTEFGGAILQHLRADENGISAFEAQTQLDGAVEELQRQAEQVAQQYQDNEAWTQSIAEVSDNLLGQLNAVGRFTPQNNQAYVNGLVAPWYSTLASNLGITPAEAYARYPLQVSGNVTASGFEQNDIVGKNEALSSLSKLSQVVYDETYSPQDAYDALYEAANPKQKTVLRALSKEQMLGFEYPHQALDELRRNPEAYQTSPAFKGILTKAGNNQFNQSESQVDTPEFKAWFGDSKVVDADGKPLVVYHGGTASTEFSNRYFNSGSGDGGWLGKGFYFTPDYDYAQSYVDNDESKQLLEVFVSANNPYIIQNSLENGSYSTQPDLLKNQLGAKNSSEVQKVLKEQGYDSIILKDYEDEGAGIIEVVAFEPTQIKSAIGNRGTFDPNDANILNQSDFKDLIAQHNLSADNLLFADRMGGLAVPSLAVTKKQNILEGFGEITLLAAPEMVDPKGYAKAKVFGADIYSPRYPDITYQYDRKTLEGLQAKFADAVKATGERSIDEDGMTKRPHDALRRNTATKYQFLKDNGIEPDVVFKQPNEKQAAILNAPELAPFIQDNIDPYDLFTNQAFIDANFAYLTRTRAEEGKETFEVNDDGKRNLAKNAAYELRESVESSKGVVDRYATQDAINNQFNKQLSDKYEVYIDGIVSGLNAKEKLFKGYTERGKQYIDHTLENVVKALKKELRGGENWNYGLGSVRAKYTPEFKSIAEIRKNKSRLIDNGNFEDVKNEMDDALESISDGLESFHVFSGSVLENTTSMLRDVPSMGIPKALKENGFENVSEEMQQEVAEFLTHLKNMPTEYFEVKILRDVAITEFSGAVVPKNVDSRVLDVLKKNGVKDIRFYDESTPGNRQEVIGQFENLLFQKAEQQARGQISFSNDITQGANITLLKNADASTFIHELGHFFLEVYSDVASKPDAPQVIVDDMNQLFNWFGIESTEQPAIDVWRNMNIEQKRFYHEKLARSFEQYAMEGTAPTLELSRVFAKLRSFMLSAYKSLKQFFERSGEPGLTPEVRQVFDRMLASEDAINKAQAVRGMMPMFASMEEAGMSVDEYAEYLQNQQDATDEAKAQLTARSLRDMKWLQGARSRVLRDLQRQADAERRAVRMAVRREVMTQPVYQAYSWLKQIPDESKAQQAEKVKATKGVDVEKDSLYTAIAKLGGLNRELAASEWGIDPKDKFDSGVFGKPVLRKEGGLSPDAMAEALAQYEYLTVDENGKWDLREFEDKFFEEARGERQYSLFAEGEQYRKWQESIYDEQERVRLDAFGKGKLDLNSMKAMYGEEGDWRNLGIGRTGMVMTDGVAPDAVAELFGFNSGDHLVKSLLAAENPKELVERLTNERMLAEFGDLVDVKKMNEAADKAVHNEVRARVLATELSAQNKALGNRRILEAAAKEYANRQVAGTLVRDLKSSKFTRAESKSAKMADAATRKGDTQTAVQAKRDQLLNNRAAKATLDANDKVEATLKYLKKFDSEGVRKNLDIEYIEQIDDILTRFDLRSGQSLRAIDKRKSLLQWVEGQKEIGLSPVIDEDLLNEARRTSYKDLPFEQFMALADSIRNIEHLGRLKKTLLTAKDKREFAERMAEARESINNNGNRIVPERATPNDFIGKTARFGRRFSAAHRKFSSFMRELDGGKDLGVMQDMLLYSMYEAGSLETDLRAKATDDMQRLFATIEGTLDKAVGNLYAIKRLVPGTNISLTHEQRIMFAMNWGNDGNRQRLLDGGLEGTRSISNEDASAILDTITKDEWDFIQGVWDYIATFKPMIAEQERKLTGREPQWIDPSPINTKFGTYAGGYFPAKYDAQMSTRSESLEAVTDLRMAMKGAFNSSGTRDGYTQARAEAVKGRPILLSFDTISRHIHEVTHRLAWQEWLTDATRVVTALDGDIRERLGAEALQEIHQHIRDVAIGDAPVTGTTDVLLSRIRTGTSIVGMGYRVSTALLQPSGIFQSWGRLGIGAVANGIKTVLKNPVKTHEWVMENSPMMRNRARTLNREINEIVNQVRAGKNLTTLQASYFYMISKMQIMIDMPTYVGAYEKALGDLEYEKAGSEDERKAIEAKAHSFAGQTVIDTQTGGEIKDLAGVQKGSQGQKLFTNFYSYFSALYNLNVENYRTKKLTNPTEFADFVATALLLNVMPVIYSVALKNLLKGECDWDDTECLLGRYKSEQMSAIFGQMIGVRDAGVAVDVATGGDAFGYSGPPSLKFFSELYKFGQQSGQGEVDMPLFKALNNAGGILFHYPAGQINSTVEGMIAIERGEVDGVNIFGALISGPPKD